MSPRNHSRKSDNRYLVSPKDDNDKTLRDVLRESRLNRHLTQEQLARKLGVHQRQISDLERSTIDPRLSTIQNVARALDLELMLIPRQLISTIEGLQRAAGSINRPMYALDDDEAESHQGDQSRVEVGSPGDRGERTARRTRRSKDSR